MMNAVAMSAIEYPIIGQVEMKSGAIVPMIEIKMMSDERWKQLAEESAVKHFREWHGREPETVQEALEAQRAFIERLEKGGRV